MLYIFDEVDKIDDDIPDVLMSLLSGERREKIQKLKPALSRKASLAVYLLLRKALLEVYGIDEAVSFDYTEKGKPLLKDYPYIYFSLSHSENVAACVVSDHETGVDIQKIVPVSDAVAKRVLTDEEYAGFKSSLDKDEYFCEIWTVKESFLKKTGQGIAAEIKDVAADTIKDKKVHRGKDYFCCVCGNDMAVKHIGREDLEQLRN